MKKRVDLPTIGYEGKEFDDNSEEMPTSSTTARYVPYVKSRNTPYFIIKIVFIICAI